MNKKITAYSHPAILLMLSVLLGACAGDRVVQTVDDSADYKSARSLPPLNKKLDRPAGQAVVDQAPVVEQTEATQATAVDQPPVVSAPQSQKFVNSELISVNDKITRLLVELPVDSALDYLADKLVASGQTVHHRNAQARRISIGCGDIQSAPSNKKKSRWTLSGRRPIGRLDYCVLELDSARRGSMVKVLDLNQQEVEKSAAEKIFQGILVN